MAGDALNIYEFRVLRMVGGIDPWEPWGSWIGACLEFLKENGYIAGGFDGHFLTEKGRACLAKYS